MSGPCFSRRTRTKCMARSVASTCAGNSAITRPFLEEAQLLRAVTHQQVLGLLIVAQHHTVRFTPNAGLLVAAKGGMSRIGVVAVDPHTSGLNSPSQAMAAIDVTSPQ